MNNRLWARNFCRVHSPFHFNRSCKKTDSTISDKILFVSDKISWELPGEHSYLQEMRTKVYELEIDQAILIYLNHIWDQRNKLKLVHPWLIQAREELHLKI